MSFFNKNEENIDDKKYRLLINDIKNKKLDEDIKQYLIDYIEKIKKGGQNDFYDLDTLIEVITKISNIHFNYSEQFITFFNRCIKSFHQVVNISKEDYEQNKEMFCELFLNDLLSIKLYDNSMYAIFQNKMDYFEIMSVILSNQNLTKLFSHILDYINSVSKYCLNQDILKRDIISYLNECMDLGADKIEEYSKQSIEIAKKRIGIYNLSPKELASCDTKLGRMESYLEQFDLYKTNLEQDKSYINSLVTSGVDEINKEGKVVTKKIRELLEIEKKAYIEKMDKYLLELEEQLKDKSDETFNQLLLSYQEQVASFREIFKNYSMQSAKDLINIQKATQDSIQTLQNYITNEPQLQSLIAKAEEQKDIREKIIKLVEQDNKEEKQTPSLSEGIVIPPYERIMIPYKRMILPEQINASLVEALDESIPFDKRLQSIEAKMKAKEEKGEIYHEKVKEIVIDIMEGDWPYLWGPSGTGKSYLIKQAADLLGLKFIKAGKITEPYSILGYNDPQGRYRITPTFIATLYGYLLSLDEFDNGNPDTQVVLNDLYSELLSKINNPKDVCEVMFGEDIPVDINPNFRMISAGNTSGEGENHTFSSRSKMDESIQERLTPIYIYYDGRLEQQILKNYPNWYDFFVKFRNACLEYAKNNGIESASGITTTRDSAAIKKYIDHNSKTIDQIMMEKFIQVKDTEYLKFLARRIAAMYDVNETIDENPEFNGHIKTAKCKTLAKKFIYHCNKGDHIDGK